ncbi:MAG: DUF3285 domain-containing protein [Spirulina sp.]
MTHPPTSDHSVSESSSPETTDNANNSTTETLTPEKQPSYVKLAMRNMVRKRGKSLTHFLLSTLGVLAFLIGISYLTR